MKKILLTLVFALVGLQNAFASTCAEGMVYFQAPAGWTAAYAYSQGKSVPFVKSSNGWWALDASKIGYTDMSFYAAYANFFIQNKEGDYCNYAGCVTSLSWDKKNARYNNEMISCAQGGDIYIYENPVRSGETVVSDKAPNAKYFFVMIPPDMTEWMSAVPMISLDGGQTGKPMKAVADMCGWYSYVFWNEEVTDNVVLFRDDDINRVDMIGLFGNWETGKSATPMPLGMIFDIGYDTLLFVPDEEQKTNEDGWYFSAAEVDGIEGTCEYTLAALIYDTDAQLHPSFSCYAMSGEGCQFKFPGVDSATLRKAIDTCIGVTPGLVETTLDPVSKKPKMSEKGKMCFIDEKYFNQLFNYTEGVNEKSCFDMPFRRSSDGKWEFDSDFYTSPGTAAQGGFYPVENSTDAIILAADPNQMPLAAARTKRPAEGPVFYGPRYREIDPIEGAPLIDLVCNGPGWDGGHDCTGLFADGDGTTSALQKWYGTGTGSIVSECVFGWSCSDWAPSGWAFFETGTETFLGYGYTGNSSPRWASGTSLSGTGGRNQHYCFESHAHFVYKPGLRFNFRGDDDIWVYIDNQLAVDIGGTHLAAPGYVDLDKFKGTSGALEPGKSYDLDIFFCDRRTTMSNVRIKTNMYIQQKQSIDITKETKKNGGTDFKVCYTVSADGSCAAAAMGQSRDTVICDSNIANLPLYYTLVRGNSISSPAVEGLEQITTPGMYVCGIDLTNLTSPKVYPEKVCLAPGRYTLFMTIDGKTQKVTSFRQGGFDVDVVYANAQAVYIDDEDPKNDMVLGRFVPTTSAMGGQLVPVYISTVVENTDVPGELIMTPTDAVGVEYTLTYDSKMKVYYKDAEKGLVELESGKSRKVSESGVDTVYATVPMVDLTDFVQPFDIGVAGGEHKLTINYFMPFILFVSAPDSTAEVVTGSTPKADGTYEEYWVGTTRKLYLAIVKPGADGAYYPCVQECNGLSVHMGAGTSPNIDVEPATFNNGFATVSVRSMDVYRYSADAKLNSPATIEVEFNSVLSASYSPIYFNVPPVNYPVLADVFDVRGAHSKTSYSIPEPYFSKDQDYLDGIADSVVIYYDHKIHKDSLPSKICILWDSASAKTYNPFAKGYSTDPGDSLLLCNELASVSKSNLDCSKESKGYCGKSITMGGLKLSEQVKTSGVGRVYSYTKFVDKGKTVKQGFGGPLMDRIAPVPLRAELSVDGDNENLKVYLSEPVKVVSKDNAKSGLDFYLSKADAEKAHTTIKAISSPVMTFDETSNSIMYVYKRSGTYPQVGDYVRLAGGLSSVIWSDKAEYDASNSLRAKADAAYYWNSPTSYKETKRLPSQWVTIERFFDPEADPKTRWLDENGEEVFAEPNFRVEMVGPFEFKIVMEKSVPEIATKYSVMDLQGRIIRKGDIRTAETNVPVLSSGTYVVKVGLGTRRVNVH